MLVGILETGEVAEDLRARHGDYPAMFARLLGPEAPDFAYRTWRVVRGDLPARTCDADAWLITGSRHGVYDPLPWIDPLKDFLRACLDDGVPVVGICFGHQILAEAMGGRAEKVARGWGLGVQTYRVVRRPSWLDGLPEPMAVRAIHQDQVVIPPPDTTTLASSDFCPYAALAYGDPERPRAISVQPHPEFGAAFLADLIEARAGSVIPADIADAARATLDLEAHSEAWACAIVRYLRQAAAARPAA